MFELTSIGLISAVVVDTFNLFDLWTIAGFGVGWAIGWYFSGKERGGRDER
jgi:hypothetical protein